MITLPFLPLDKAAHAFYGAAIFAVCGFAAVQLGHPRQARVVGAAAALLVGLAWEAAQWWLNKRAIKAGQEPPHRVEAADVFANTGGALFCWAAAVATEA